MTPAAARQAIRDADAIKRQARKALAADRPKRVIQARAVPVAKEQRQPRKVDRSYKGFVAGLFCIATYMRTGAEVYGCQVCHIRFSLDAAKVVNPGMGRKSDDWRVMPMLPAEHHRQHCGDEEGFWLGLGIPDVYALARQLRATFPDAEAAKQILRDARRAYAGKAERKT